MIRRRVLERIISDAEIWHFAELPGFTVDYFPTIIEALEKHHYDCSFNEYIETEAGYTDLCGLACVRLGQAKNVFLPWLEPALPLTGKHVMQIGCGTGPATVPLCAKAASMTCIDISASDVLVAKARLASFGLSAQFIVQPEDWITSAATGWAAIFSGTPDIVVLYALLEHLTPIERVRLLKEIWEHLPVGGHLVVFETPNRLAPIDWHTNYMLFPDILPDELSAHYATLSARRYPQDRIATLGNEFSRDLFYRFGKAASFHEFVIAIGLEWMEVVHDGYANEHQKWYSPDHAFEAALHGIFARQSPPIPPGFARPSLDLVLRKK